MLVSVTRNFIYGPNVEVILNTCSDMFSIKVMCTDSIQCSNFSLTVQPFCVLGNIRILTVTIFVASLTYCSINILHAWLFTNASGLIFKICTVLVFNYAVLTLKYQIVL